MFKKSFKTVACFLLIMLFSSLFFGCSKDNSNTYKAILESSNKISNTLNKIDNIDKSDLIIEEFMNQDDLKISDVNIKEEYFTSVKMNKYFLKLTNLNNVIIYSINLNNSVNTLKAKIQSKLNKIKLICNEDLKNENMQENGIKSDVNEILKDLSDKNTRLSMSRNEVNNNLKNVIKNKKYFSDNTDNLTNKYLKLNNTLTTRYTYLLTMFNGLQQIENIISVYSDYDLKNIDNNDENNKDICFIPEEILSENNTNHAQKKDNSTNQNTEKSKDSSKKIFKRNIDTYEKNDYQATPELNQTNPSYVYGNNMMPGYMGGYNMPGGYGAGMYGYPGYGGFMYPNINTYWSYKNIDTYNKKIKNKEIVNYEINAKEKNNLSVNNNQNDDQDEHFVDNQITKPPKEL